MAEPGGAPSQISSGQITSMQGHAAGGGGGGKGNAFPGVMNFILKGADGAAIFKVLGDEVNIFPLGLATAGALLKGVGSWGSGVLGSIFDALRGTEGERMKMFGSGDGHGGHGAGHGDMHAQHGKHGGGDNTGGGSGEGSSGSGGGHGAFAQSVGAPGMALAGAGMKGGWEVPSYMHGQLAPSHSPGMGGQGSGIAV